MKGSRGPAPTGENTSVHESYWDQVRVTDEHLPVIDGVSVLEDVEQSSDGRVLHVEGETRVAILELLDGLCGVGVLGIVLGGEVRRRQRRVPGTYRTPFGILGRTWT